MKGQTKTSHPPLPHSSTEPKNLYRTPQALKQSSKQDHVASGNGKRPTIKHHATVPVAASVQGLSESQPLVLSSDSEYRSESELSSLASCPSSPSRSPPPTPRQSHLSNRGPATTTRTILRDVSYEAVESDESEAGVETPTRPPLTRSRKERQSDTTLIPRQRPVSAQRRGLDKRAVSDGFLEGDRKAKRSRLAKNFGQSGQSDQRPLAAANVQDIQFQKLYTDCKTRKLANKVFRKILNTAYNHTTPKDIRQAEDYGCVYTVQNSNGQEYVKIGKTSRDPDIRKKELSKCKLELESIETDDVCFEEIPCHTRLEALIHLDLYNVRHFFDCTVCGRQHKEWFKIDKAQALRRVQAWKTWIKSCRPYDEGGLLKKEWKERINRCKNQDDFWTTLEVEIKDGRGFESFMSKKDSLRDAVQQWMFEPRLAPQGKLCPSRFKSFWTHKNHYALFGIIHFLVIGCLNLSGSYWLCAMLTLTIVAVSL